MNQIHNAISNLLNSEKILFIDKDDVLSDGKILELLKIKGYGIIRYQDHITFRHEYEPNYRSVWERGQKKPLVILTNKSLKELPYDLSEFGVYEYNLNKLFPRFNYPAIKALPPKFQSNLYEIHEKIPKTLNEEETIDLIVEKIFRLNTDQIGAAEDIIKWLLSAYFITHKLPEFGLPQLYVDRIERLTSIFLPDWPMKSILSGRMQFIDFLQKEWAIFIDKSGSPKIPFEEPEIKLYIRHLFTVGYLKPLQRNQITALPEWARIGVAGPVHNPTLRFDSLIEIIKKEMPCSESNPDDWLSFSMKIAEARLLNYGFNINNESFAKILLECEQQFEDWILRHYGELFYLPYLPNPYIVTQISHYLAYKRQNSRIALIVMDGMSLDDWLVIREKISANFQIKLETTLFAAIPSTTEFSRRCIFSGKKPSETPINVSEKSLWKHFWSESDNLLTNNVEIVPVNEPISDDVTAISENPNVKVLGLIINKVDDIIHGTCTGMKGVYENIKIWMDQGLLLKIIDNLIRANYKIFITSDHGNTECKGRGLPKYGSLAESKCKRVMIYDRASLRDLVECPDLIKLPLGFGLPDNMYPVIPHYGLSFDNEGAMSISHGGISIEEVIIPLIEVGRKED